MASGSGNQGNVTKTFAGPTFTIPWLTLHLGVVVLIVIVVPRALVAVAEHKVNHLVKHGVACGGPSQTLVQVKRFDEHMQQGQGQPV